MFSSQFGLNDGEITRKLNNIPPIGNIENNVQKLNKKPKRSVKYRNHYQISIFKNLKVGNIFILLENSTSKPEVFIKIRAPQYIALDIRKGTLKIMSNGTHTIKLTL